MGEVSEAFQLIYFLSWFVANASRASDEAPFVWIFKAATERGKEKVLTPSPLRLGV